MRRSEKLLDVVGALCAALLSLGVYGASLLDDSAGAFVDDLQTQYLPAALEVGGALRHHEWALLAEHSWGGGALAGEYQYGVFSPVELASAWLVAGQRWAPPALAAMLVAMHLPVLAAGAYALARGLGVTRASSVVVALAASLNGWIFGWGACNWYPAFTSFTWVPWSWFALDRLRRPSAGAASVVGAAVAMALGVTAGWPFTDVMLAVVAAFVVARRGEVPRRLPAARVLMAGALALCLSAPAWMSLLAHGGATDRAHEVRRVAAGWQVPWSALPALLFPGWSVPWRAYSVWTISASPALFNGLVPAVGVALGLRVRGAAFLRERAAWVALLGVTLALSILPSLLPLRASFRWLPLFHVAFGVLGALGLDLARAEAASDAVASQRGLLARVLSPANAGATALALLVPVAVMTGVPGMMPPSSPTLLAVFVGLAACWCLVDTLRLRVRRAAPAFVAAASLLAMMLFVALQFDVPIWQISARVFYAAPCDARHLYLSVFTRQDIWAITDPMANVTEGRGLAFLPGNTGMYSGTHTVHGYSPLGLRGLRRAFMFEIHGEVPGADPTSIPTVHVGPGRLLDLMGVDGLILPARLARGFDAAARGWSVVGARGDAVVYHRALARSPVSSIASVRVAQDLKAAARLLHTDPGGAPVYQPPGALRDAALAFGEARVTDARASRLETVARVAAPRDRDALLLFSRAWYPGFVATLDGRPLEVGVVDLVMPAVRLPAGASGRLVLAYRPWSLRVGLPLSALAELMAAGAVVRGLFRGRRSASAR